MVAKRSGADGPLDWRWIGEGPEICLEPEAAERLREREYLSAPATWREAIDESREELKGKNNK